MPTRSPDVPFSGTALLRGALCLVVLAGAAGAARAQSGPEELAEDAVDRLGDALDEYEMAVVEEALQDLDMVLEKLSGRTRRRVVRALVEVLETPPRKAATGEGIDPREELVTSYMLVIGILYDEEEGADVLADALDERHVRAWPEVRGAIAEGLGYRRDPELIDLFVDLLEEEQGEVVAAAAWSLGQYAEMELEVRREAVEALVEGYLHHHEEAEKEERRRPDEEVRRELLVIVEGPFDESLTALTRQSLRGAPAWEEWLAEHGSEDDW